MPSRNHDLATRAVHAGSIEPKIASALITPIFQSSVWETPDVVESYDDILYPRLNNLPNHVVLGRRVAALEGAEAGLVFGSGMAASTTTLLAMLGKGGHLLVQDQLYGGTRTFLDWFDSWGLEYDLIDGDRPETWAAKLRDNTRAVYVEAITNPLVNVADHDAVVAFAREHGLLSLIDNTFTSPVNFRAVAFGFDIAIHSCTKYLNGHSDLVAGAVAGSSEHVGRVLKLLNHLGGSLDPHACFLLERGIKTLVLRVREQNTNALALASWLADRPEISRVYYPGLEAHPHHVRARELFAGFGGMLSFELAGGTEAAERLTRRLEIVTYGPSLGGVETLVTRPSITSHAGMTPEERAAIGITDGLVRVSVGIEAIEDLQADFAHAFAG